MKPKDFVDADSFVRRVLDKCKNDNGFAARLRRADNPDTEYYALGDLCALGINIEKDSERLPAALIAAAISRNADNMATDGSVNIGAALRLCLDENEQCPTTRQKQDNDIPDSLRLRRLLACERRREACLVLRPILSLVHSKIEKKIHLCYAELLRDLLYFSDDNEEARRYVKQRWMRSFCFPDTGGEYRCDETPVENDGATK